MVGIYKITSPSGKVYIGQSWDIKERVRGYKKASWHGKQPFLFNSFKKYGIENHSFEIVCELPIDVDQKILNTYEIFYWQQYIDCGFKMMNAKEPGIGGKLTQETKDKLSKSRIGKQLSPETKEKLSKIFKGKKYPEMSERFTGEKNPFYGKKHSDEVMAKISKSKEGKCSGENNSFYGRKHSDEVKEKMSEIKKGKQPSAYCRLRSSQVHKGSKKSDEVRANMSKAQMGHKSWNKGMKLQNRKRPVSISYSFGHLN